MPQCLRQLLANNQVLTHGDVAKALGVTNPRRARTKQSLLRYHLNAGHIIGVRRGLYVVVPPGSDSSRAPAYPLLLAAKAADDSVLAYQTALEFHGKAYSVSSDYCYFTHSHQRPWAFRDYHFRAVPFPKVLVLAGKETIEVQKEDLNGQTVRVTSLERTMVDVLDRPDLAGGYEQAWRSLELIEYFDIGRVVAYALLLKNSTTIAKVGFFLDQHRERLMVEESHLEPLRKRRPKNPQYFDRHISTKLVGAWNLLVPRQIVDGSWQENP